ncbi:MAG: pentapeptide repeat-containing protein [Richelia sp. SM1_7_0]|nr:pentapeptide repeat-containing protein [Richelia sp. SM1_7_0]
MPPDYSGQNLRGRSFKGQNLAGADFSHADIRGTNFTGANLRGANFTGAKAGLQKRWALLLVLLSWLLSGISGFLSLFNTVLISSVLDSSASCENQISIWVALIVTIIIYIIIIRQRISVSLAFAGAFAFVGAIAGAEAEAGAFAAAIAGTVVAAVAGAFAAAIAGTVVAAIAGTVVAAIAGAFVFVGAFAVVVVVVVGGAGAFAVAAVSAYIAWRSLKGDEKYVLVRNAAVAFAAIGGTSFRGADLTDADFTKARLKSTDFRTAKLIRTCFHKTKLIDRVRPGSSYLEHSQIRQLILTGQGQDKNFNRLDLRGINLKATLLTDASFIGTDLSEACLQDADLSRAKLVQTQLDNTDFTGATLTGAYIEDWNITHETNFRGVKCEYVYMRFPTKENPNPLRKPDNNDEVFSDGDFGDFIQPIFDTLDLYHNQGVDPRAIAISFKELAEKNPDAELEIVAMEKRGDDKFLLRAKTAPSADKSELSGQYFDTYNQIKGLPEREIQLLLAEKDNQIHRLENMVMTALERPSFYSNTQIEQVKTMTNNPNGDSQNISFGNVDGGNFQVARDNSNQQMEAKVNQGKELTQADVIQMLARIEQLVNSTPELPEADKEKSLRYLGAAKEETQASEPDKQLAAGNLKRMAQTIETASKTVESGKTLWGNIQPVLQELLPYFGVAKTFFGL